MARTIDTGNIKNIKSTHPTQFLSNTHAQKSETDRQMRQELENAQKKLAEKMAAGDERGVKKMQEIIANLQATVSRQHA